MCVHVCAGETQSLIFSQEERSVMQPLQQKNFRAGKKEKKKKDDMLKKAKLSPFKWRRFKTGRKISLMVMSSRRRCFDDKHTLP